MANAKIQTGLRLDEELYYKTRALAELEGRSINNLVEQILRRFVAQYEQEHGPLPGSQD